ncbi:MAG TPA: IclR family transcriptional regulator [Paralcaligenes sp.]
MSRAPQHSDPAFATTVANGLAVLECFRVAEPTLSNKDLVERTRLSKATISRLTYTLEMKGLLMYDTQLRRYRLGSALLALSYPLLADMRLRQIARPFMKKLADFACGSVSLGLYDRLHMVYIETCRGHDAIAFRPDIGARLPVLASAMGRAWLAHANEDTREKVINSVLKADPGQVARHAPAWEQARRDFALNGYCSCLGDWQADVHAVAAPLRRTVDGDSLVFNCGVPVARLKDRWLEDKVAPKLLETISEIEAALERQP